MKRGARGKERGQEAVLMERRGARSDGGGVRERSEGEEAVLMERLGAMGEG